MEKLEKLLKHYNMELKNKITRVLLADDWEGLYVNDELADEGHSLNITDVIEWLIKNDVSMGEMTYNFFMLSKNGEYVDYITEDECDEIGSHCLPSLHSFIERCEEFGYKVELEQR
ncbi:MAG: hypothetical protein GF317_11110 [Candidatus Lokiarchaeota archaeon]|nr:hypothetical protein [Candidatus Lokiarchaeota archaeon]